MHILCIMSSKVLSAGKKRTTRAGEYPVRLGEGGGCRRQAMSVVWKIHVPTRLCQSCEEIGIQDRGEPRLLAILPGWYHNQSTRQDAPMGLMTGDWEVPLPKPITPHTHTHTHTHTLEYPEYSTRYTASRHQWIRPARSVLAAPSCAVSRCVRSCRCRSGAGAGVGVDFIQVPHHGLLAARYVPTKQMWLTAPSQLQFARWPAARYRA
jgi:hypothetical protein